MTGHLCKRCNTLFECEFDNCPVPRETICGECFHRIAAGRMKGGEV